MLMQLIPNPNRRKLFDHLGTSGILTKNLSSHIFGNGLIGHGDGRDKTIYMRTKLDTRT